MVQNTFSSGAVMPLARWLRRRRNGNPSAQDSSVSSEQSAQGPAQDNSHVLDSMGPQEEDTTSFLDLVGQQQEGPQADDLAHDMEVQAPVTSDPKLLRERSDSVGEQVTLTPGTQYTVTAADMQAGDPWRAIARANGMLPERLQAFNQHVVEVNVGGDTSTQLQPLASLAEGTQIYIPSATEMAFAQCREASASFEEAVALYGKMSEGPNIRMITAAYARAGGVTGEGYGTAGIEGGRFMTPNPDINGASSRRSETVDGQTEYKVFWLADFWKCSVFSNDVVWQAGYQPALQANNHYATAGRTHEQPVFKQVKAADAMPGDKMQRFGGRGSNESHITILSSFVKRETMPGGNERWSFSYIGAESDRAGESNQSFVVDPATATVTEGSYVGKILRFMRPVAKR